VTGILDGGFLPKAATPKRTGRGAHARGRAMTEISDLGGLVAP